ncbi:rhamnogalacturonan acetylesterase [Gracilibacillus marinus]|jgi:lysophospholipase L1-like esterase|uniref:Rhamnogalacturonan acetylesterase n=1 Tax=Gracilibacillus marinus TaxID=630535 RepID=A0ABV8VQR2_9BACI
MESVQLFLAGDSTMSNYDSNAYPRMGWGQVLPMFFNEELVVRNHAASGRSTKSFIAEKRWETMEKDFRPGDFVFIQFGHNDQKPDVERRTEPYTSYQQNLTYFIQRAREHRVTPILLTSITRRHFDENGQLLDTHGDYPQAMRALANKEQVACVDMLIKTTEAVQQLGLEKSKQWYMWINSGQFKGYPDGEQDDTHLREEGAKKIASICVHELIKLNHPLATYVNKSEVSK